MRVEATWVPAMQHSLHNLYEYFDRAALRSRFDPRSLDALTVDGRLLALPSFLDFHVLYYRTDLLSKYDLPVPKTWDQLENVSRVVMAERGFFLQHPGACRRRTPTAQARAESDAPYPDLCNDSLGSVCRNAQKKKVRTRAAERELCGCDDFYGLMWQGSANEILTYEDLFFLETFRRMPTASAEGLDRIGVVTVERSW